MFRLSSKITHIRRIVIAEGEWQPVQSCNPTGVVDPLDGCIRKHPSNPVAAAVDRAPPVGISSTVDINIRPVDGVHIEPGV